MALDTDYHRDPPVMYNFLLVNDKHKVRDWLKTFFVVFGRSSSCYFVRIKKLNSN